MPLYRTLLVAFASWLFLAPFALGQSHSPLYGQVNLVPEEGMEALQDEWMLREGGTWSQPGSATDTASKLDARVPGPARREYEKAVRLFLQKKYDSAVEHLKKSIAVYANYVEAHNALGAAYLQLGQNEPARAEFAKAVMLDDHIPRSYVNLGRAELALKDYPAAEQSIQKASALQPLDLSLLTALTYTALLSHDYGKAISTAQLVHSRDHKDAAIVHYLAAAAWQGENNLPEMERELKTFLTEDPDSPNADGAHKAIAQIESKRTQQATPSVKVGFSVPSGEAGATPGALPASTRRVLQQLEEEKQIREAEAACDACLSPAGPGSPDIGGSRTTSRGETSGRGSNPWTLRSSVNEVALFFSVTHHGQSVSDLSDDEVSLRDDGKPPAVVLSFRNQSELPLRLGLVIDASTSIREQFAFEQKAATSFLREVVTGKEDQAFVVGFANSVLLVQDFTNNATKITHAVDQLAPSGGTALWDAVKFAADKLAGLREEQPAAKMLVVISDGDDNSSNATLK